MWLKSVVLGFIAGAIATVAVQQLIDLYFMNTELFPRIPWTADQPALAGMPPIAISAVLGGIWGAIFAVILGTIPKGSMTLRGALLGMIGPALIGVFVASPLLNGTEPFLGGDVNLIWPVLVVTAIFGAITAWLYGFFSSGFRLP
jgi:hypothetical protein